jgi:hypothetical protein
MRGKEGAAPLAQVPTQKTGDNGYKSAVSAIGCWAEFYQLRKVLLYGYIVCFIF